MTGEQASWLQEHKREGYRAVGRPGGNSRYIKVGILHADGTFEPKPRVGRPRVTAGCFEVGILEVTERNRQ